LSTSDDSPENPYAAPQAELNRARTKNISAKKFNFKAALWSCSLIALILFALLVPAVQSSKQRPRTTADNIFLFTVISIISIGLGFAIGSNVETIVSHQNSESEAEEPTSDAPKP
jgi:Na+/H+-dicarboxylate symporter